MKKYLAVLALLVVAQPSFAQDLAFMPKALVQFDGYSRSAEWYQSGTGIITVTVTQPGPTSTTAAFGGRVGDHVYLDFPGSGTSNDIYVPILSVGGGSFTVAAAPGPASGTLTLRIWVQQEQNIAKVEPEYVYSGTPGYVYTAGSYRVTFATPFAADEGYMAIGGPRMAGANIGTSAAGLTRESYPRDKDSYSFRVVDASNNGLNALSIGYVFYGALQGETP